MKQFPVIILFLAAMCVTFPAGAKRLYKITDKYGNVTYTTSTPDNTSGEDVETRNISGGEGTDDASAKMERLARDKPVVMYSVKECGACDQARDYLHKHGIPFTEKDVNKDLNARKELKDRTGSLAIPTILIGDKVMKGYLQSVFEGELSDAGYPVGKNASTAAAPPDQNQPYDEGSASDEGDQGGAMPDEGSPDSEGGQ